MRPTTSTLFFISLTLLLTGCLEEVGVEQKQFTKVLGLEGTSIAEKVIELDNGDLMIIGEMGRAAHEIETTSVGPEIRELEDQAPMIAITDANGNMKFLKMYPLEEFDLKYVDVFNFENRTTFQYIEPLQNGGYLAMAQNLGFDFDYHGPDQGPYTDYSIPGDVNFTPFLFKLDDQFNVVGVHTYNGGFDWDGIHIRTTGVMKALPNDEIGVLLGRTYLGERPVGYTFMRLDGNGEVIEATEHADSLAGKMAYDFDIDGTNTLKILGTENDESGGSFYVYDLPLQDLGAETNAQFIDFDGVFEFSNTNEQFIKYTASGELLTVYTNPRENLILAKFGFRQPFEIGNAAGLLSTNRAPRAVFETRNGEFLVYEVIIPFSSDSPHGYLHRIKTDGTHIFSQRIEGSPGDVIETKDGNIVVAANRIYNGLNQRIHLIKLDANGKLY